MQGSVNQCNREYDIARRNAVHYQERNPRGSKVAKPLSSNKGIIRKMRHSNIQCITRPRWSVRNFLQ